MLAGDNQRSEPIRRAFEPVSKRGVGDHVQDGRAGRQYPVLQADVRQPVRDVVHRPVPPPDRAVVQPQLVQPRGAARGQFGDGILVGQLGQQRRGFGVRGYPVGAEGGTRAYAATVEYRAPLFAPPLFAAPLFRPPAAPLLFNITSNSALPARVSLSARSITLVAEARQYSTAMPVFF